MNYLTINKFRTELEHLVLTHLNVTNFFWGDLSTLREQKMSPKTNYPLVCAYTTGDNIGRNISKLQLVIEVCDILEEDWSNINEIESDTNNTIKDIFNAMSNTRRWNQFGVVDGNLGNLEKFVDTKLDRVAGWRLQFTFKLAKQASICDAPFNNYDFEPVNEFCKPVIVSNSDGSFVISLVSGSEYTLPNTMVDVYINNTLADEVSLPSCVNNRIDITIQPPGCSPAEWELENTNEDLLDSGSIASGSSSTIIAPDSNYTLINSVSTPISSGLIASGSSANITAPDANLVVNGGSPIAIPSGDNYNLTTDDWYRPQSWPPLYEVADDAVYFLMKFSSIHDIQPFGFRTTFDTGTPKLVEIFVNGISVYSYNITGSAFVDHAISIDANTQSFTYAGELWAWIKVKYTGSVASSSVRQEMYLRFQNASNLLPINPIYDNWKSPNIFECIFNTDKVNRLISNTWDISGYGWIIISVNIRHWHLMNTSTLRICSFQSMANEAVTGFSNLTSIYENFRILGSCPFPIQGLPTTFDCTTLTDLSYMLRSNSTLTGNPIQSTIKSMPVLTFTTSALLTSLQNFASGQHLTGIIVTDCSNVTNATNAIINAPNLTLLKLIGYKISFNISVLGLWGAGIEEFALALGTASTSPTITMTTRQYNSFGGSGSAVESIILGKGFTIMTV